LIALAGANHLQFLLDKKLLSHTPSKTLDEMYAAGLIYPTREVSRQSPVPSAEQIQQVSREVQDQTTASAVDKMLLHRWNGKLVAERLQLPEMEVEIERAVEQVQSGLTAEESSKTSAQYKSTIISEEKKTK
jgi:hypothetical protein